MKNVGRGPLERGEAGVKVGDDDLGLTTSKSSEKSFTSQKKSSSLKIEVASPGGNLTEAVLWSGYEGGKLTCTEDNVTQNDKI